MEETTQHKKTPRDLLRAVFRRRLLFLSGAAIFAFAALVGALWWPVKYTAMAKFDRRSDPASEALVGSKSESFETSKQVLQQELAGFNALNAAAEDLEKKGLLPPLPRGNDQKLTPEGQNLRQQLVRGLMDDRDLKVNFLVRSVEVDLVSVEFTDKDPRLAQTLPNTLVTNYINNISEKMVTNLTASRDFLQKKVDEANTRLTELTRKRTEFEREHAGMLPENPGTLQQEVQRIDADMDRVRRQQSLAQQKLDQIKAFRAGGKAPADNAPPPSPKDKPEENPAEKDTAATKDTPATKGTPQKTDTSATKDTAEKKETPGTKDTPPADKPLDEKAQALEREGQALEREMAEVNQELSSFLGEKMQYERSRDEGKTIGHMTEKHPRMVALNEQIKKLDDRIAGVRTHLEKVQTSRSGFVKRWKESQTGAAAAPTLADASANPLLQRAFEMQTAQLAMDETAAQLEINLTNNELARLKDRRDGLTKVLEEYVPKRQEYVEIVKKVTDQQAEVNRWQTRLTDVQMALAAEAAKYRTHLKQVELAQEQFKPSSPKLVYVLLLALVGGLAFGSGLVFLVNTVDRSVSTTEEAVDCFGLPILGIVGEIVTPKQKTRRKMIRWGLGPVAALLVVAAIGVAAMTITLWLNDREKFEDWKHAPASFVWNEVTGNLNTLKDRL
jgi:uncharacterized protein involved in exopolysaccharide biosynthesis